MSQERQTDPSERFREEQLALVRKGVRENPMKVEFPQTRIKSREEEKAAPTVRTFPLTWFAALDSAAPQDHLVKNLLLAGSLFVVYGESNSGKTFFVLDLALAIAAGIPWRGMRTKQGLVVYIAGEGGASVRARVAAYRKSHPDVANGIPFAIVPCAVDFLSAEAIDTLIVTIKAAESEVGAKTALVLIDTFARAVAGGDENSAQDVGTAVANADRIRTETGAAVGFVHHAGKDPSKGARGSSALRAATDTEILIEGVSGPRTGVVNKQRDLEGGQRMAFELVAVNIGADPEDGSPITSCILRHTDAEAVPPAVQVQLRSKGQRAFVAEMRRRTESQPEHIWLIDELREVARQLGMSKTTARNVVDAVLTTPYMQAGAFGYLFVDGRVKT